MACPMKPILQNILLIGVGWMLSSIVESTLFATLWAGFLAVIIFCTSRLCHLLDCRCPVAVDKQKQQVIEDLLPLDKEK